MLALKTVHIRVMRGDVPVGVRGHLVEFFILWILLKKCVENQGKNSPSSCKVLPFEYRTPSGNKRLETQRIGYFRSFLLLISSELPFIRTSLLLKKLSSLFYLLPPSLPDF